MSLHKHNKKWYCDTYDLQGLISESALYKQIYRGRNRVGGNFESIKNPCFSGKGSSRRLVLIESLPTELRKTVENNLRCAAVIQQATFHALETEGAPPEEIVAAATQITANTLLHNTASLKGALKKYMEMEYRRYLESYLLQGHVLKTAQRCARSCAWVVFVMEQEAFIEQQASTSCEEKRLSRALHMNLHDVLCTTTLGVQIPASQRRYLSWWQGVKEQRLAKKEVQHIINPLRLRCKEASKLTPEVKKYLDHMYAEGPSLPIKQIYALMLERGKEAGWFISAQGYKPPVYSSISKYLQTRQGALVLSRGGESQLYSSYLPTISRQFPTQKNAVWGADGTAHNVLVKYNGRIRQCVWAIYLFDYATGKLLACAPWNTAQKTGKGESATQYIDALSEAIRHIGYAPELLQLDHGPALNEVTAWCKGRGIQVVPAGIKNARAKLVEGLLGRLQNLLTRHCPAWSGMNLTTKADSSKPSATGMKQAAQQAQTAAATMAWLRFEQLELHNQLPFTCWDGKKCDKTPDELWTQLRSATHPLSALEKARLAGHKHVITFTKSGLTVQHAGEMYTYFPDVSSDTKRKKAISFFSELQPNSPEKNKRTLYITDYAAGAYVFTKDWDHEGNCLGYWPLKKKVPFVVGANTAAADRTHFSNMRKLQKDTKIHLQAASTAAKEDPHPHPHAPADEWAPFNKARLQAEEETHKAEHLDIPNKDIPNKDNLDEEIAAHQAAHLQKRIHPHTGVVYYVSKKTD